MGRPEDAIFVKIATHNHILDEEEISQCRAEQEHISPERPLAEIALERGLISQKQFDKIVEVQARHLSRGGPDGEGAAAPAPSMDMSKSVRLAKPSPGRAGARARPVSMTREIAALETSTAEESDAGFAQELAAASGLVGAPLAAYLKFARDMGASDLHLQAGEPPFVRAHGFIHYMEHPILSPKAVQGFIGEMLTPEQRTAFIHSNDMDLCYEAGLMGRFRVNCFRQRKGLGVCFRLIPGEVPTLEELGLPAVLKRFTTFHQGIVLITGPSGCGKSSTMAALIEIINRERKDHVITVEDPIEFRFESKRANISQRQVQVHTRSWEVSLRAALREDPDVIMIGEMRDLDTISTAVTAAETGHLVLGTLHTSSATRSIDRILDVFPPKEQAQVRAMVSESLRGVISQVLIPIQDGKGRVPAVEIMFNTPAIANLIRDQKTFQIFNQMQTGRTKGMQLMDDAIKQLVKEGRVKKDMGVLFANDPKQFMEV